MELIKVLENTAGHIGHSNQSTVEKKTLAADKDNPKWVGEN